jgi:XTP/dITP diphosphohydrolase
LTVAEQPSAEAGTGNSSLVLSTRNPHKVREMERLLAGSGISVMSLPAGVVLPPEDGATFSENALGKARAAAGATGRPAVADDSGIEAAALGGAPGVRSARFAGPNATDEENLAKLRLQAPVGSGLRYVCALAYVDPSSGDEQVFCGYCLGVLADSCRGSRGFGYDPVFVPQAYADQRTMAELSDQDKDAISHRGEAVRAFLNWLGR